MQVLKEITLDKVINLYEGQVVHDKKQLIEWDDHRRTPLYELKERTLAQDKMILGADSLLAFAVFLCPKTAFCRNGLEKC